MSSQLCLILLWCSETSAVLLQQNQDFTFFSRHRTLSAVQYDYQQSHIHTKMIRFHLLVMFLLATGYLIPNIPWVALVSFHVQSYFLSGHSTEIRPGAKP